MTKSRKVSVPLKDLIVNPDNYRFDPVADEEAALSAMMQSLGSEVAKLARDIHENGLSPLRNLLVVYRDGHYVVLDGNRRATALKLLDNPEIINEPYPLKQVFKTLKTQGYTPPQSIEVTVYDENDLDEADRWVYIEHNGKNGGVGTVNWGSKEKARFSSRHNKTIANKALQLTDFLEGKKIDTKGVDLTNLNRLLADPYCRKRIGVTFVKGALIIDDESSSLPAIKKVVTKLKAKEFKVRKIYSKKDRKTWIDKLLPPPVKKTGKAETKKSLSKSIRKSFLGLIDPSEPVPEGLSDKIEILHEELINIYVGRNPHATAALLRIYMELISKEYVLNCLGYREQGEVIVDASGKGNYSELKAKLVAIQTHSGTPKDIRSAVQILVADVLITTRFNQVMHSQIFLATEHDLRSMWVNLQPVMKYAMIEIAKVKNK